MKNDIYIAFIEPSTIIREGIMTILRNSTNTINYKAIYFDNINQLSGYKNIASIRLVIVNSAISQSDVLNIQILRNELNKVKWVGCISSNHHRDFFIIVDNVIYLSDRAEKINNILKNCLSKYKDSKNIGLKKNLSKREIDVLKLLVKGNANKEIADKLNISIHTVITHRKNITQKLGIKSIAAMVIYAVAHNIIDINDNLNLT